MPPRKTPAVPAGPAPATHDALCLLAETWLKRQGFGIVFRDAFKALTDHGECPDAIGWRGGVSALIECKTSRADFLADRSKPFRLDPAKGMGDWRFYLCPPDIIEVADIPAGWGLLHVRGRRVVSVHGVPSNCDWRSKAPFAGAKMCETQMLCSALRRMVIRGHFAGIYAPMLGHQDARGEAQASSERASSLID